jgi:nitrogenase subunit NifH
VQRLLLYPLFLQQIKSQTVDCTPEHMQISQALLKMEQLAEYMNEMQRVYEEYGALFARIHLQHAQMIVDKVTVQSRLLIR